MASGARRPTMGQRREDGSPIGPEPGEARVRFTTAVPEGVSPKRYTLTRRLRLYGRSICEGELCLHAVRLTTAPGSKGQATHLVAHLWDRSKAGQAIFPLKVCNL